MSARKLSVIIITWNESKVLERCLESFYNDFNFLDDEIIVVDNGSNDDTLLMLKSDFPSVTILPLNRNHGVGPARNRGIALSTGKYIMTLDNDTIVGCGRDLTSEIERIFDSYENIGVFGFKLLNNDNSFQQSCRRYPGWLQPLSARIAFLRKFKFFNKIHDKHLMADVDFDNISYPVNVDYVLGANQIFRRETFARVFGYDENIFFGPEDFDFCYRVKNLLNRDNYIFDDLSIIHDYQRRTRKFSVILIKHIVSFYYVMMKNKIWKL